MHSKYMYQVHISVEQVSKSELNLGKIVHDTLYRKGTPYTIISAHPLVEASK